MTSRSGPGELASDTLESGLVAGDTNTTEPMINDAHSTFSRFQLTASPAYRRRDPAMERWGAWMSRLWVVAVTRFHERGDRLIDVAERFREEDGLIGGPGGDDRQDLDLFLDQLVWTISWKHRRLRRYATAYSNGHTRVNHRFLLWLGSWDAENDGEGSPQDADLFLLDLMIHEMLHHFEHWYFGKMSHSHRWKSFSMILGSVPRGATSSQKRLAKMRRGPLVDLLPHTMRRVQPIPEGITISPPNLKAAEKGAKRKRRSKKNAVSMIRRALADGQPIEKIEERYNRDFPNRATHFKKVFRKARRQLKRRKKFHV